MTLAANTVNNDAGTNFGNALSTLNKAMTTPGQGTNQASDTPQGVLLIVTDGVDDVALYNSWPATRAMAGFFQLLRELYSLPATREHFAVLDHQGARHSHRDPLYDLLSLTSNSWYNSTVAPFISQVPANLQNCASSPNLYFEVATDGDITTAMQQLFSTLSRRLRICRNNFLEHISPVAGARIPSNKNP